MFEETKELKTVGSVDQCQPNPLKKKKGLEEWHLGYQIKLLM